MNTCFETTNYYHAIAYYSHLVPIVLGLFLGFYSLYKTKLSELSVTFFAFTLSFSIWLIGDLVDWVSPNYYYVYFTWAWLDYVNIIFFILGAYFFGILVKGKITNWEKALFLILSLPAFIITITGNSVVGFDQAVCEAYNSEWLTYYKFFAEALTIVAMIHFLFSSWLKSDRKKNLQFFIVFIAILLFFVVFGSTEYIASITGIYEINLYGLFVLPVFLIIMVFSITNLGLFQFRLLGTQISAYVLIITVGSQLLFIKDTTNQKLTIITLGVALFLAYLLLKNAKIESLQREKIEKLAKDLEEANGKLKELDQMKSEFLSLATHQIRAPLTAIKGYSSMLIEGDFGVLPQKAKDSVETIFKSCQNLINIVGDFLNISRIEQGRMVYEKSVFDIAELTKEVAKELAPNIQKAGLTLELDVKENLGAKVNADIGKIKQVIGNIIDNAIKYTVKGAIKISVETDNKNALVKVKDSGIGISPEEIGKLFNKFTRAKDANKTNVIGTGLGLYIAKKMTEAHGGDIKIESEGLGKGTTFIIQIPRFISS